MTIELNQNGFQITSRDKILRGKGSLGKFLNFVAETASISDNPKQVVEDGVKVIKEASSAVTKTAKP